MILPARDYHRTHIKVPDKLHEGLDRTVHTLVGLYQRRSALVRSMQAEAEQIAAEAIKLRHASDRKLRDRLADLQVLFRRRKANDAVVGEALMVLSEVSDRTLGLRPYPVQILGAMIMHQGCLAEMATGEGKSLTACLPAVMAGWTGRPCHVITVNDYLGGRDAALMKPFYGFCNVTVGCVTSEMNPEERSRNYNNQVVYTTSKEILADFLRDRLRMGFCHQPSRRLLQELLQPQVRKREGLVMRGLDTAIVDEADSVLIDEAVTPLIISQPQANDPLIDACNRAFAIGEQLIAGIDYKITQKYKEITLTQEGENKILSHARNLPGLWRGKARREELIIQALNAREFYQSGKQYVVQDGKVIIVDEFTGRLMPNRTWRHGLHQAVEAREGMEMSKPSETLVRLSFQRFFSFYRKLAGMTGTAREAAGEFWDIYQLPVITVPTHRPCIRKMLPDRVFAEEETKWKAIAATIEECHKSGRPVLVGTRSVKASQRLAAMLRIRGLEFNLLNAVRHKEEAKIVATAGEPFTITIATNMAGRGTDIKLGRGVDGMGGLHVIATERHESGRIDRQLFGRCARQGDPGSAQVFVSAQDELIQRFLPPAMQRGLLAAINKELPLTDQIAGCCFAYAQHAAQRLAFKQRKGVLQMDTWLAEALSFTGAGVEL